MQSLIFLLLRSDKALQSNYKKKNGKFFYGYLLKLNHQMDAMWLINLICENFLNSHETKGNSASDGNIIKVKAYFQLNILFVMKFL